MNNSLAHQIKLSYLSHFEGLEKKHHLKKFQFAGTLHLYCLNLFRHDGVSNHCFEMATLWSLLGLNVKLYSYGASESDRNFIGTQADLKKNFDANIDLLFFMFSIGDPFLDEVAKWPGKKVIFFQGITPPSLVAEIGHQVVEDCKYGIGQYPLLQKFDLVGTSSIFNLKEIQAANQAHCFSPEKLFWLPPFVSMDKMDRIPAIAPGTKPTKPFLLYVGRLFPNKNVHRVVEIFAKTKEKIGKDLDLFLVGSGHLPEYKNKILNAIQSLPVDQQSSVKQVENVTDNELKWFYENAEALVHLSLHEGFGLTLAEAMKCKTPVITHDVAAIKETMKHSGVYLDSSDIQGSADLVVKTLASPNSLRVIESVQTFVYENFYADERLLPEYISVTERMLSLVKNS